MDKTITCENGLFNVPGNCLPKAAKSRKMRAIQMVLSLGAMLGGSGGSNLERPGLTLEWAEKRRGRILVACARSLGRAPGLLVIVFFRRWRPRKLSDIRRLEGFARGLQEEGDEELGMRVTVLVEDNDTSTDLAAASEEYQQRLVNGGDAGASAGSFMQELETELQTAGEEMPAGLEVVPTGPPSVISEFVVAVSEWLFGSWERCSAVCGAGMQTRKVECSAGEEFACLQDLDSKPIGEQVCEDHTGCPFAITCPLGQDNDMECTSQAGVVFGTGGLVGACFLAFLFRRVQLARRPHTKGTVTLPDTSFGKSSGLKASYQIYRPDDMALKSSVCEAKAGVSIASLEDGDAGAESKTRVVWDTNRDALKQMFAHRGTQLSFTAKTSEKSERRGLPRLAAASRGENDMAAFESVCRSVASDGGPDYIGLSPTGSEFKAAESDDDLEVALDEIAAFVDDACDLADDSNPWGDAGRLIGANGKEFHTAFREGERAEYYSCSLNRWLQAKVHVTVNASTNAVRYDAIIIATDQRRVDVAVQDLRRPLRRGEVVEVLVKREWMPGAISQDQPTHATNFGYLVDLEGGGQDKFPGSKVRRRYAVGDRVKAYRGCIAGWVQGRIEAIGTGDAADVELAEEGAPGDADASRLTQRHSSMATIASQSSAIVDCQTYGRRSTMSTQGTTTGAARLWSVVSVNFEEEDSDKADVEWLPTFLIR